MSGVFFYHRCLLVSLVVFLALSLISRFYISGHCSINQSSAQVCCLVEDQLLIGDGEGHGIISAVAAAVANAANAVIVVNTL